MSAPPALRAFAAPGIEVDAKAVSTLVARAALAGFELAQMADCSFVIARWGLVRALPSAADVEAFLAKVGAPA